MNIQSVNSTSFGSARGTTIIITNQLRKQAGKQAEKQVQKEVAKKPHILFLNKKLFGKKLKKE